ncbi:MAG: hypothetical protein VB071_05805, partial [Lawsonibacter sp.]|nr:hypothetical protein [Lawsonibacter sp.]
MTKPEIRNRTAFGRWTRLALPSLFLTAVIYYEELFLKLYCFRVISLTGALFTLLFTLPVALLFGLLCGGLSPWRGRIFLPLLTALTSLWLGAQAIYYHLFKTFLTLFSLTKMAMVAGAFGNMATVEVLINWFPVLMMSIPVVLSVLFRAKLVPDAPNTAGLRLRWAALAAAIQLATMGIVMLCGGGVLSLRYIYTQTATPELEAQYFGMLTQTQLEVRRVLFGIDPDDPALRQRIKFVRPLSSRSDPASSEPDSSASESFSPSDYHIMDIDFDALAQKEEDAVLLAADRWFSQREPTAKNEWTGYFKGKNLV